MKISNEPNPVIVLFPLIILIIIVWGGLGGRVGEKQKTQDKGTEVKQVAKP